MNKIQKHQSGFTVVETFLVILVVAVMGLGGYYVWQTQHNKKTTVASTSTSNKTTTSTKTTTTTPATPSSYAGWKAASMQYEQITYQYPSDWTIKDSSAAEPKSQNGCTYPGHDLITLNSPSGTQVAFNAGQDCFGGAAAQAFGSVPINALGQSIYLVFEADTGPYTPTAPNNACLAPTTSPDTSFAFKSKNIFYNGGGSSDNTPVNSFCYIPYNPSNYQTTAPSFTIAQIEATPDYSTAKLIFESMHY